MKLHREAYQCLLERRLVTWRFVDNGFRGRWISKREVADFATAKLAEAPEADEQLAFLSLAGNEFSDDVEDVLSAVCASAAEEDRDRDPRDLWLLGHLIAARDQIASANDRHEYLDRLCDEMGYPDILRDFWKYGGSSGRDLDEVLAEAIATLEAGGSGDFGIPLDPYHR